MTDKKALAEVLRIFGQMANRLYPDLEYFDDSSQPDTILDVSLVCGRIVDELESLRNGESGDDKTGSNCNDCDTCSDCNEGS